MLSKTTNPRWTAPEVIRDSQIGTAGDVYSFAIIMWEMLTWQQPYEEMMSVQVSRTLTKCRCLGCVGGIAQGMPAGVTSPHGLRV